MYFPFSLRMSLLLIFSEHKLFAGRNDKNLCSLLTLKFIYAVAGEANCALEDTAENPLEKLNIIFIQILMLFKHLFSRVFLSLPTVKSASFAFLGA